MKTSLLAGQALINYAPASQDAMELASVNYESFCPASQCSVRVDTSANIVARVKAKELFATSITYDGNPAFMVWWNVTTDGFFVVEACVSLETVAPINVLFVACERIALASGAKALKFKSRVRGLLNAAMRFGYLPDSVIMVKGF